MTDYRSLPPLNELVAERMAHFAWNVPDRADCEFSAAVSIRLEEYVRLGIEYGTAQRGAIWWSIAPGDRARIIARELRESGGDSANICTGGEN